MEIYTELYMEAVIERLQHFGGRYGDNLLDRDFVIEKTISNPYASPSTIPLKKLYGPYKHLFEISESCFEVFLSMYIKALSANPHFLEQFYYFDKACELNTPKKDVQGLTTTSTPTKQALEEYKQTLIKEFNLHKYIKIQYFFFVAHILSTFNLMQADIERFHFYLDEDKYCTFLEKIMALTGDKNILYMMSSEIELLQIKAIPIIQKYLRLNYKEGDKLKIYSSEKCFKEDTVKSYAFNQINSLPRIFPLD